jgi:hypothetical protein
LQQRYNCIVEPIPRPVLAAAQLKSRSSTSSEIKDETQLNEQLSKVLPYYVIESLAGFQKEAVQFIMEKKGRALVGDVRNDVSLYPLYGLIFCRFFVF